MVVLWQQRNVWEEKAGMRELLQNANAQHTGSNAVSSGIPSLHPDCFLGINKLHHGSSLSSTPLVNCTLSGQEVGTYVVICVPEWKGFVLLNNYDISKVFY